MEQQQKTSTPNHRIVSMAIDMAALSSKEVQDKYSISASDLSKKKDVLASLSQAVADKEAVEMALQKKEGDVQLLQQRISELQKEIKSLQQNSNNEKDIATALQMEREKSKSYEEELQEKDILLQEYSQLKQAVAKDSNTSVIPKMIDAKVSYLFGEVKTGNFFVTLINGIECVSIFACCMYILPTTILGVICGVMLSSILWYAQYIIKSPKYIGVSLEFIFIAFFVMLISISLHYAAFVMSGGINVNDYDATFIVAVIIPALSFATLFLRYVQAKEDINN